MSCKVSFAKKDLKPLEVSSHSNVMKALLENGRPVASSCGGEGVCGKCRVTVLAGSENLTPANDTERFLKEREHLGPQERISCQCEIVGDVQLDTRYW
jgi:2Fe-2S ferredoxin